MGIARSLLKTGTLIVGLPLLAIVLMVLDASDVIRRPVIIGAGSYTGAVTDGATGRPIDGAAVYMAWQSKRSRNPLEGVFAWDSYTKPAYLGETLAYTDAQGRYKAPEKAIVRWINWRMSRPRVEVLIYKKGYVGYNNNMSFDGRNMIKFTGMFRKKDNDVRLQPWQEGYSHHDHYHYMEDILIWSGQEINKLVNSLIIWEADSKYWRIANEQ